VSDPKRFVRVPSAVLSRDLQGEAVLLQLETGEYFGLDETGARIWQLIVEKGNLEAVEAALCDEFDVDAAVASSDLNTLVDELVARKLIEIDERA
jgi:hypothetical protein